MSKLNKKICLRLIAHIGLLPLLLVCSSFQPPKSKPYGLTRVVIDAGHGGHDSGCLGKKIKEKDVALGISLKLGHYIEEHYPDVKVIFTRKSDEFVELYERAQIANNAKADLFICIHCNSACVFDKRKRKETCNGEISGVETWVMGLNKSEANLEVSKRENEVILLEKDYTSQYDGFDPNSPEANIIFSLYQNTYLEQSLRMASFVQQEVKSKGRGGRGVKQAGFLVLYKTFMPSILIETGFLSNDKEEKYLGSEKGQDDMAQSIFKAFQSYKSSIESTRQEDAEKSVKETKRPEKSNEADRKPDSSKQEKSVGKPEIADDEKSAGKDSTEGKSSAASNAQKEIIKRPVADNVLQWSVQFYTSPTAIPDNHKIYKTFDDVREYYDGGIYKYAAGLLNTKEEAIQLQSKIRAMGYKDAFVVAFFNNKRISVKEATELNRKKAD